MTAHDWLIPISAAALLDDRLSTCFSIDPSMSNATGSTASVSSSIAMATIHLALAPLGLWLKEFTSDLALRPLIRSRSTMASAMVLFVELSFLFERFWTQMKICTYINQFVFTPTHPPLLMFLIWGRWGSPSKKKDVFCSYIVELKNTLEAKTKVYLETQRF